MKTKVDIVIPVYYGNKHEIEKSVSEQVHFYQSHLKDYEWKIIIGVNGPDKNEIIEEVRRVCSLYPNTIYVHHRKSGKGVSVLRNWENSNAHIVAFMDVDLATDLFQFPELIRLIDKEGYALTSGSRWHPESRVARRPLRLFISWVYINIFIRGLLGVNLSDPQAGFKAMDINAAKILVPLVHDDGWFFETEMVYIAEKLGMRIKEIPIIWRDDGFSGVNISKAIPYFISEIFRLKRRKDLKGGD